MYHIYTENRVTFPVLRSVLELVLDQGEEWKNKRSEEWKK